MRNKIARGRLRSGGVDCHNRPLLHAESRPRITGSVHAKRVGRMLGQLSNWLFEAITYDLFKRLLVYVVVSAGLTVFLRYVLHHLQRLREVLALWIAVLLVLVGLFYFTAESSRGPKLQIILQDFNIGSSLADNTSAAILVAGIVNSGTIQTIATDFRLTIKNKGNVYQGEPSGMPKELPVSLPPGQGHKAIKFFQDDALYNKAVTPIPPGGMIYGVLMFTLPNVDAKSFIGSESEVTFSIRDAWWNQYTTTISGIQFSEKGFGFHTPPGVRFETVD
jgi:hypothetical protein